MIAPQNLAATAAALVLLLATAAPTWSAPETSSTPANIGDGWQVATPGSVGIDGETLAALLAGVAAGDDNIHGVLVERHGKLVAELYRSGPDRPIDVLYGVWNPSFGDADFGPRTLHDMRSISKSVVGLLVGIAIQRGEIGGVEQPVLDLYPELADLRATPAAGIRLEHLLSMSSGLEWDEGALPNDETRLYWKSDTARFVLERPLVTQPGAVFHYDSGGTAVLADVLERRSGRSLEQLSRDQLFTPMGITESQWVTDIHGRALAFTGLRLRPRDLLSLGRLVLDGGTWGGRELVPAAWVKESLRPHVSTGFEGPPTSAPPSQYGYQWWGGTVPWGGRTLSWSAAFGNGGQRLFVVPELDLAVAVTAGDYGSADIVPVLGRLFASIVATVKE